MRTTAALCLLAAMLVGCSPQDTPDVDAQLQRLAEAIAAMEDAIDGDTDDSAIVPLVERARAAAEVEPDASWTGDQRARLMDLLRSFEATLSRWESGKPAPEVEPGLT